MTLLYIYIEFEWDGDKAQGNTIKHGVQFGEATSIWRDTFASEAPDLTSAEDRWLRIGLSNLGRVLVVVYCERDTHGIVRIISARKANAREEERYYEQR